MDRWKKGLVLLIATAMVGTAVVATQYVQTRTAISFSIATNLSFVQFMANDGDPNGNAFVLNNSACSPGACATDAAAAAGSYRLRMGTWMVGAIKDFSAAFAVVNAEKAVNLRLQNISIDGLGVGAGAIRVYVHSVDTQSCVFTATPTDCRQYVAAGADTPPGTLWTLNNGTGAYTTAGGLKYGITESAPPACSGPYQTGNGVFTKQVAACAQNNAVSGTGAGATNHVWVEIVITTAGIASGDYAGFIYLNFQSV